jgi:hypothetical protein
VLRLSRDQALEVLTPHAERLYRIGTTPFASWQSEYPNLALHTPRTRANVLYDLMVNQARIEFRGIRGTAIIDPPSGVVLLDIDQQVLIRFKKLDDDSLPRNYPTLAAKDWDIGEDLPGIPSSPQRLSLGYRLNRLQTTVKDVMVSNTLAGRLLYDIILDEPDEGIIVLPDNGSGSPPSSNPAQRVHRRVRIRGSEEQAEI